MRSTPPAFNIPNLIKNIIMITAIFHAARLFLPEDIMAPILGKLVFFSLRYTIEGFMEMDPMAAYISPVGYVLVHGNWMHLLLNMGMLLAFGSALSKRLSVLGFLSIYALGAVCGAAIMTYLYPESRAPLIGASAAVSAVLGGILAMSFLPRKGPDGRPYPAPAPFHQVGMARNFTIIWVGMNLLMAVLPSDLLGAPGQIAWQAHLAGLIPGLLLTPLLDKGPQTALSTDDDSEGSDEDV
jgi:membrane associated rhomboid family serine protease